MSLTRRQFIGSAAGALSGTILGCYAGDALARLARETDVTLVPPRGPERQALSVCGQCPGGCGIRVRCVGPRAVKIEGNRLHPISGGRLCHRGQAGIQSLYHPDRIRGPLRRVGPRGSRESFRAATWNEAFDEIGLRLSLLRQQARPEALALLRGGSCGIDARVAARFVAAFGSPNDVVLHRGGAAAARALWLTQGIHAEPAYDVEGAEYVLTFGGALLEASGSPVHTMRSYGTFRQARSGRRGRLVHVGPHRSLTAASADEWIPVRAGTEGVLALGIASVLVSEELYDKEFVRRHTHQFEDWLDEDGRTAEGLRNLLPRSFGLERVSAETGVSVNRILQVARDFAAARPGLAVAPRVGPLLPGRLFDHLAAHLLNALVGNVDGPGGALVPEPVPLPAGPEFAPDPIAEAGRRRPRADGAGRADRAPISSDPERLAEAILARSPYGIDALLLLDADPLFASLAPDAFAAAIEQVPLVVSFARLPDDTSLCCDWILPQSHALERWELQLTPAGVAFPLASLAKPALGQPLYDTKAAGDVLLELARRVGGPVAAALPWADLPALIRADAKGLYEARRGAALGTDFDEAWVRLMERAGWWAPGYGSEEEMWKRFTETGGWWDPLYDHGHWKRVLATASGRFEFRPRELADLDAKRRSPAELSPAAARSGATGDGSLALVLFEPLSIAGGTGAELPLLQETLDPGLSERWETWVELHPESAAALGVTERSMVRVTSPNGSIRARARVTERVVPDTAALPVGLGKRGGGRWAAGIGANPLVLLAAVREPSSGLPDPGAIRVRVTSEAVASRPEAGRKRS